MEYIPLGVTIAPLFPREAVPEVIGCPFVLIEPEYICPQPLSCVPFHVFNDPQFVVCVFPLLSGASVPQAGVLAFNILAMEGVVSGIDTAPDATLPPGKLDARYFNAFALLLSTPEGATDIV